MVWFVVFGVTSVVGLSLLLMIGVVVGGVVGVVWVIVLGVVGVVVTGGSTSSVEMLLLMSVVVWVVVVCEDLVVSVDESTSLVDVVFCGMLRSACSAGMVLYTIVGSAC